MRKFAHIWITLFVWLGIVEITGVVRFCRYTLMIISRFVRFEGKTSEDNLGTRPESILGGRIRSRYFRWRSVATG